MKFLVMTIQMKATVGLLIVLYKMVASFESVDKIFKCDHSNENY